MKERPILFSAEMVRAILGGRKTQTRRVVSPPPPKDWSPMPKLESNTGRQCDAEHCGAWSHEGDADTDIRHCPYGTPGDRLWVRETFVVESNFNLDSEANYPPPFNDGRPIKRESDPEWGNYWKQCHYRATDELPDLIDPNTDKQCGWKPSLYMPRWASRLTLEIVKVRVERVQDISGRDVWAEGVDNGASNPAMGVRWENMQRMTFEKLWDSINAKRGFGWNTNPWVWVIEFRRIAQ